MPPPPPDPSYEARLEAVLESVSEGFYALDADWRFVVFNRAAEEYFGGSRKQVLGKAIWDIFPQGRGTPFEAACRAAMEKGVSIGTRLIERGLARGLKAQVTLDYAPRGLSFTLSAPLGDALSEDPA